MLSAKTTKQMDGAHCLDSWLCESALWGERDIIEPATKRFWGAAFRFRLNLEAKSTTSSGHLHCVALVKILYKMTGDASRVCVARHDTHVLGVTNERDVSSRSKTGRADDEGRGNFLITTCIRKLLGTRLSMAHAGRSPEVVGRIIKDPRVQIPFWDWNADKCLDVRFPTVRMYFRTS